MNQVGKGKISESMLKNPFEDIQKKGQEFSVKYCAWEVLKDYCQGLNVTQIAKEIQERGLKDFSEKKNAAGQVSGDLVRGKGVFWHDPERKLWWIRPLAPIVRGNRSKSYGTPSTRNKKNSPEKGTMNGSSLVGLRVTVWWDGEKAFFDGQIDGYDETVDRFRIVYDDGDADESMQFHKYVIISKEGELDTVKVLEHNLDDIDATPGVHEVAAKNFMDDTLAVQTLGSTREDIKVDLNEWKPTSGEVAMAHPVSNNQGCTLPDLPNPDQSPQKDTKQQDGIAELQNSSRAGKKKAARITLGKSRNKKTGKPGRPPKRSRNQSQKDVRSRKRQKPFQQEGETKELQLEDGPQQECAPAAESIECRALANPPESDARQTASEAAGSTCENNSPQEECNKTVVEEKTEVCDAQTQKPGEDGVSMATEHDIDLLDASTPPVTRQVPSVANNETSPLESEPIKADDASGCVILRRKRSVMNRKGLQPGSSRVWGGSSLESRSNAGDENQAQFETADQSLNASSRQSPEVPKSPASGKSSRCASPESISCTMPNDGGKSIGRKCAAHGKEPALLQGLTKDLNKSLSRGASIDMLDLTKGLFTHPRAMEPPLGQLGDVGELMSLSQLSEELKAKCEEVESQREAEVTSAPPGSNMPVNCPTLGSAALVASDRRMDGNDMHMPESDSKVDAKRIASATVCSSCLSDNAPKHCPCSSHSTSNGAQEDKKMDLPEKCDAKMETSRSHNQLVHHQSKSVEHNIGDGGAGAISFVGNQQAYGSSPHTHENRGNETHGLLENPEEEAKTNDCDPQLGTIAGPSVPPCEVSNSESRESAANLNVVDNSCWGDLRNSGGNPEMQECPKLDNGFGCPSSLDTNNPSQRHVFPPMPIGMLKWSAPLLQSSNLKRPCPIDGLKKHFEDWPYTGFFPPESVTKMKNLSERGCRPG